MIRIRYLQQLNVKLSKRTVGRNKTILDVLRRQLQISTNKWLKKLQNNPMQVTLLIYARPWIKQLQNPQLPNHTKNNKNFTCFRCSETQITINLGSKIPFPKYMGKINNIIPNIEEQ